MTHRGLAYAEETLGVHKVHEEVEALLKELDDVVTELDKAQDSRRYLAEDIAQRETDLLIRERGENPGMSATALDQHMKSVKQNDTDLMQLRFKNMKLHSEVAGLEYDLEVLKLRVRAKCARMEELGGYFRYLAQLKAETPTTQEQQA